MWPGDTRGNWGGHNHSRLRGHCLDPRRRGLLGCWCCRCQFRRNSILIARGSQQLPKCHLSSRPDRSLGRQPMELLPVTRKRPERFFNFQTTGVLILGASWSVLYIGLILSKGFNLPTLLLGIAISSKRVGRL